MQPVGIFCETQRPQTRLCDNLEGWDEGGRGRGFRMDGTWIYLWLIHVDVWQKPTQYPKAIILQLKVSKLKKKKGPTPRELTRRARESGI